MFRRISQKARKQDGFTLIELIVVVAILGILAAVLTPRVLDAIDNARRNSAEAIGKQIQLAMERYALENDQYPTGNQFIGADTTVTSPTETTADLVALLDDYLNLEVGQFTEVDYTGLDASQNPVGNGVVPVSYLLTITLSEADRTVNITPTTITVN